MASIDRVSTHRSALVAAAAAIFVCVQTLTGCNSCNNDQRRAAAKSVTPAAEPVTGGDWIVGSIGDASSLLPIIATDSASYDIIGLVYCRLLKYDKNLEITTDLAESYQVSPDGQTIRVVLRSDARWHDGVPVTADDVVFTVEVLLDPATPTPYKSTFDKLDRVEKLDAHTVAFHYKEPYAPALESLATVLYLLPKHLLENQDILTSPLNRNPVGCGPYRFVRWEEKREIELRANPDYYAGRPNIEHYLYRIIPDQATMFLELKNLGLDQMGLTPQQYTYQTGGAFQEQFQKFAYTGFNYTYLGFNLRRPMFQSREVRRALAHAVNKDELIEGVLLGLGQKATGPLRPGMWYYHGEVSEPIYDPNLARELLEQAGWRDTDSDGVRERDGVPLRFTIITNQGNQQRKQTGEILVQRFAEVGAAVDLRILEWATFLHEFVDTGNFDAVILGWNTGIDPDQYDIWHSSRIGPKEFNFVHFQNAEVDRLLEVGRTSFDQETRRAAYARIQEILAWEQPYIFLYIPQSLPVVQRRVRGIEPAPAGIAYNFEDWWIPAAAQGFHRGHTP